MKGGEIRHNKALDGSSGKGGGVRVGDNGTFIMEGGTIRDNESRNDGGGVYISGVNSAAFIRGGSIGVQGGGNKAKYGGGVYVGTRGRLNLGEAGQAHEYPYIENNRAGEGGSGTGGGLVIYDDSGTDVEVIFHHGTIRDNHGDTLGGGILLVSGNLEMKGGSVRGNIAATGPGITVQSHQYSNTFTMNSRARVLDDNNPVFLHYDAAYGTRGIILGTFTGDTSNGIAKIALASVGYTPGTGYIPGTSSILSGMDASLLGKFTVIYPPNLSIDSAGTLQSP
jgi:hypothetical protein